MQECKSTQLFERRTVAAMPTAFTAVLEVVLP